MAKSPKIRISKKDREEFARLRKNSRAKINRVRKKYGVDISSAVRTDLSIDDFETRKEYNIWKEEQISFTSRGNLDYQFVKNKYGVVASKQLIRDITKDTKQAQKVAREELEKLESKPVYYRGERHGTVKDRIGHFTGPDITGIYIPKDFDFQKVPSLTRLHDIAKNMKERSTPEHYKLKRSQMQENFIKALQGSFNSESDKIVEELKKMDGDLFYNFYLMFPDVFDFTIYDSDGNDVRATEDDLSDMLDYIQRVNKGEIKMELNQF